MKKWELKTCLSGKIYSVGGESIEKVWKEQDERTGKTTWNVLEGIAKEGWELVSVTAITSNGGTIRLLYTFKRPIEDGS